MWQKSTLTILVVILSLYPQFGAVAFMSSDSFRIWTDTVSSGGNRSNSVNFIAEDTISEPATGEALASANFLAEIGLPAIFTEPVLIMTISADSASLLPSPITTTSISTSSYTITVSTDAPSGYSLRATEDTNFASGSQTIPDVADGQVSAGTSEYGIAVAGVDAAFADDRALSANPLTLASRTTGSVISAVTTVTHRAGIGQTVSGGTFSHVVTHVAVTNY